MNQTNASILINVLPKETGWFIVVGVAGTILLIAVLLWFLLKK